MPLPQRGRLHGKRPHRWLDLGGSAAQTFAAYEQGSEAGGFKAGEVEGLGDDNFYWHAAQAPRFRS